MARSDWVALVTEPAAEYTAATELTRLGLHPYLPQAARRWSPPDAVAIMRRYPIFPRYLLLPVADLDHRRLRLARGLRRARPILADGNGRPWRVGDAIIGAIRAAEEAGDFDDILVRGDKVRINDGILANIAAFLEESHGNTLHLLTPLLGGATVRIARTRVSRAE